MSVTTEASLIPKLEQELTRRVSKKRLRHIRGVIKSVQLLADRFGADKEKAAIAAYFHDLYKQMTWEESLTVLEQYRFEPDAYTKEIPATMHGTVASVIARYEYAIQDMDILNAIMYHTTGRAGMSLLEKIVCLADYIEENRQFDGVDQIRFLAETDVDSALYAAMQSGIRHLLTQNQIIHPNSLECRNDLLRIHEMKKRGPCFENIL